MSLPVALLSKRQDGRNNLVGSAVLARWLGVTDKTVRELAKTGIAVRSGKKKFTRMQVHLTPPTTDISMRY